MLAQVIAQVQASGVHIDWSISIGQVLSGFIAGILAIIGAYGAGLKLFHAFDLRMTRIEGSLSTHSDTLTEHSRTMKEHEGQMVSIMQDVARLMGLSGGWNGSDRRKRRQ